MSRARGLRLHLDGARLWNASVATGIPERDYAAHFDSVSVCFSKSLGARVATASTEKNGGIITSSAGLKTAKNTWGQPAEWCDYSGSVDGKPIGITLLSDPNNFRPSWWHNRDYGVFVANPFGRAAMKQGTKSAVTVKRGEDFRLRFGAVIHSGSEFNPTNVFGRSLESTQGRSGR